MAERPLRARRAPSRSSGRNRRPARAVAEVEAATTPVSRPSGDAYFSVAHISLNFGGLQVLDDVSLEVGRGEIVGLIGPNGAGKTTLFDVISGFHRPTAGRITLNGVDLTSRRPYMRAWHGLGRTFQMARLFQNLTVFDTVRTAHHVHMAGGAVRGLVTGAVGTPGSLAAERRVAQRAQEIVERLGLGDYQHKLVSELSYGTLRMTELATVLAMEPDLVLLDEPSSGIAQRETEALGPLLLQLRESLGATFLVIEHDMPLVMGISDRIYALATGVVIAEGTPREVQRDPLVIESYLGGAMELAR